MSLVDLAPCVRYTIGGARGLDKSVVLLTRGENQMRDKCSGLRLDIQCHHIRTGFPPDPPLLHLGMNVVATTAEAAVEHDEGIGDDGQQ
jgi:hypothetical protein